MPVGAASVICGRSAMKLCYHFALLVFVATLSNGQGAAGADEKIARPLPRLSNSSERAIAATRAQKPVATITLTNDVSQDAVLAVTDRVNAQHGIDGYADGYCGFGARLGREYVGRGSLVMVSFAWDHRSRQTIVSLHRTNAVASEVWLRDMTKALRDRFGENSIKER